MTEFSFYDIGTHQMKYWDLERITVIAGTGLEGVKDGNGQVASFHQVSGMCVEYDSIFITDLQAGTIRLTTCGTGMATYLKNMGVVYKAFNVTLGMEGKESLESSIQILHSTFFA